MGLAPLTPIARKLRRHRWGKLSQSIPTKNTRERTRQALLWRCESDDMLNELPRAGAICGLRLCRLRRRGRIQSTTTWVMRNRRAQVFRYQSDDNSGNRSPHIEMDPDLSVCHSSTLAYSEKCLKKPSIHTPHPLILQMQESRA